MLGKGEEVEDLDAPKLQMARSLECIEVRNQALQPAREIDETIGGCLGKFFTERLVQATARRIHDDDIGALQCFESIPGGAGQNIRPSTLFFRSRGEPEVESEQAIGTAFIEAYRLGSAKQSEADRSDTAIVFRDRRLRRDEIRDALDRRFEEWKMILTERTGRKEDVDTSNRFLGRGVTGQLDHRRAEDRIAAVGLCVEEESL